MAGLEALQADAWAQPPDREPSQAEERFAGGERHTVVGTDGAGQAEVPERSRKNSKRDVRFGGLHAFAADQDRLL